MRGGKRVDIFFVIAVLGIGLAAVLLPSLYGGKTEPTKAATTWTVCASGCDFTTISSATAGGSVIPGDTIQVRAGYSTSTEANTITLEDANLTLECQSSSLVIGTSTLNTEGAEPFAINMVTGTVVQGCTFHNASIKSTGKYTHTIQNNIFTSTTLNRINLANATSTTVTGNRGEIDFSLIGTTSTVITDNIFYTTGDWVSSSNVSTTITSNTINIATTTHTTVFDFDVQKDLLFTYNRIEPISGLQTTNGIRFLSVTHAVSDIDVQDNSILSMTRTNTSTTKNLIFVYAGTTTLDVDVQRNTLIVKSDNEQAIVLGVTVASGPTTTANVAYNLMTTRSTGNGDGILFTSAGRKFNTTVSYNGFYSLTTNFTNSATGSTITNSNPYTSKPYLRDQDSSTANDFQLAQFSPYLDVNSTNDIGSYSAARGTSFALDDNGTIDYSTVHATTTDVIENTARDGDTFTLAAGTYQPIRLVTSSVLTGENLTIQGVGSTSIISGANTSTYPIYFQEIVSSTVKNLVVQNATSTDTDYFINNVIFEYSGSEYDDSSGVGAPADDLSLILTTTGCVPAHFNSFVNGEVSGVTGVGSNSWNLALVTAGGSAKLTIWAPNNLHASAASVAAACSGVSAVVNKFVTSTLSVSNGVYTYDSSAVAAAGITIASGFSVPNLERQLTGGGIVLRDTTNMVIQNVTSTGNVYGVTLKGSATTGNTFSSSTIQSSVTYDVNSYPSTGTNSFKNVTFTRASSTFGNDGILNVYFKARAKAQTSSATAIAGVRFTLTSADSSQTASLSGGSDGFTAYSDYLLAFKMTSSSVAVTNGGYNPYSIVAAATSTYSAATASENLSSANQTVTVTMTVPSTDPIGTSPPPPITLPGSETEAMKINGGAASTTSRLVTITIAQPSGSVTGMAVSEDSAFPSTPLLPFKSSFSYTLSSGLGRKTVYVKLITDFGTSKTISDSIALVSASSTPPEEDEPEETTTPSSTPVTSPLTACPLQIQHAYKEATKPAVYYITDECTKRAFTNPRIFFTYFTSWGEVRVTTEAKLASVPNDALGFMPAGPLYRPLYGALVKVVSDPKVYLLLGGERNWIASEVVFNALRYAWNWIEDVDTRLLNAYTEGSEIIYTDHHPNYTLIKYADSTRVYRLEPDPADGSRQVKRWVPNEQAFLSLTFRWDRIVTIPSTEVYTDGTDLGE